MCQARIHNVKCLSDMFEDGIVREMKTIAANVGVEMNTDKTNEKVHLHAACIWHCAAR